jgi:CRP/FNR family transcriptional regulator, dissimilatory nitrate respiration regulator
MSKVIKNFQINFYDELKEYLKTKPQSYTIKRFNKKQVLHQAGSPCDYLGIVLNGAVSIEHHLEDGKRLVINHLAKHEIFGEILLFSLEKIYPYDIIASTNCDILYIDQKTIIQLLMHDKVLLEKYLIHLSNSYATLNRYIKLKSQKTIVNKLAYYLVKYEKLNEGNKVCHLTTKTQLADFLGVERQSLIRELNHLRAQGVLDYDKECLYILNLDYFKQQVTE